MQVGASTPEELDTLLEDAFLTRDLLVIRGLFEEFGVLMAGPRYA